MKLLIIRPDELMHNNELMLVCYRKDVRLPLQLQRAMAAEAEAAREARAKVIAAEGEMKASRALKEASDVIAESPAALQV
jgi:erythrocyte band 7 integral membrane protein